MKLNKRILIVMSAVLSLFVVMVGYLTYFTLTQSEKLVNSEYNNARQIEKEQRILRGEIFDRQGTVLAETKYSGNLRVRSYPYKGLYTHSIGYSSINYGKSNLELSYNKYLMRSRDFFELWEMDAENDAYKEGADLHLTLDHGMTELAASLMQGSNGSVVVLNPKTGEIYCLYSNPTFDPNESALKENWSELNARDDAPFLARTTKGLYPPGSTFKVITAEAGLRSGNGGYRTDDKGKTIVGSKEFKNHSGKSYGNIGMEDAIRVSSNVYFTELSEKIGKETFVETIENFLIHEDISFDIPTSSRTIDYSGLDKAGMAAVSIGQGELLVTPLKMAMVAGAVANNGMMMQPYLVESASYNDGSVVYEAKPKSLSKAMNTKDAQKINEYMVGCVEGGTGTAARVSGIKVAGKTGTAENERKGKDHGWFIGFAPADDPQIAICVMKEYSGRGGGSVCAPVARDIIRYAYNNGLITK